MKILDCQYIEGYYNSRSWKEQKQDLLIKYSKMYPNYKIKIVRVKSDTKGLRCYEVWGKEN